MKKVSYFIGWPSYLIWSRRFYRTSCNPRWDMGSPLWSRVKNAEHTMEAPWLTPPKKFKRVHLAVKVMASIFWDSQGVTMIDYLDNRYILCRRITVEAATPGNHKTYSRCFALAGQRPCPHVTSCHDCCHWMWIWNPSHPPYSSDMSHSDFYLFPKRKSHLHGTQYGGNEGVIDAVNEYLGPGKGLLSWRDKKARTTLG